RTAFAQVGQQSNLHHHGFDAIGHVLPGHVRMMGPRRFGDNYSAVHAGFWRGERGVEDDLDIAALMAARFLLHAMYIVSYR
ncbi:hypothetical protein, partial [Klebsiella pneumoniae]|uniref:hypothetical protein n=1 Tax=Klebsiella pneumoniae TaxID=573 RepID=UPI001BA6DD1A